MQTLGAYFSVAFSVIQADGAGAVGVGVGAAVEDAVSLVRAALDEAADGPHAVVDMTTAATAAAPATRRREIHGRSEVPTTSATSLFTGFRD